MSATAQSYPNVVGANIDDKHPNGDLDRIVLDGMIMPKRRGRERDIARGEDIVWLLNEGQKNYCVGADRSYTDKQTFSREVLASQVNRAYGLISSNIPRIAPLDVDKPITELMWVNEDTFPTREDYDVWDIRSLIDVDLDKTKVPLWKKYIKPGDKLTRKPIEDAFNCAKRIRRFNPMWTSEFSRPGTIYYSGNVVPSTGRVTFNSGEIREWNYSARRNDDNSVEVFEDYYATASYELGYRYVNDAILGATYDGWCLLQFLGNWKGPNDGLWTHKNCYKLVRNNGWKLEGNHNYINVHSDTGIKSHLNEMMSACGFTEHRVGSDKGGYFGWWGFYCWRYFPVITFDRVF